MRDAPNQVAGKAGIGTVRGISSLLLIQPEERGPVLYFSAFFVLVGAGMALGRGTADALFLKRYGIEYLPVMYMILGGVLAVVSAVYAAFVDRLPSEQFFRTLFAGLVAVLLVSWSLMSFTDLPVVYPAYFLVYEVSSELLLVHGGFYVAQNLDTLQAKRLAPLILAGTQIGMLVGGVLLAATAPWLGVQNLLLVWSALLLLGVAQAAWWHRRRGPSAYFRAPRRGRRRLREALTQVNQGLRFTRDVPLLRYASLAMFSMVVMFYVLCYGVNRVYATSFDDERTLTAFFGILAAVNGFLALALQLLVTNRLIDRYGVRRINLVFPVTSLASFGTLLASFSLPAALVASVNKDVVMTAFRNPVHSMFFNVLPPYIQGRARAMSVVLVMPLALLVCGAILWLAQRVPGNLWFLAPGAVASLMFLHFSRRTNRAYVAALIANLRERLYLPEEQATRGMRGGGEEAIASLSNGVAHPDEQVSLAFARALVAAFPEEAAPVILPRIGQLSRAGADQLVRLLGARVPDALREHLLANLGSRDAHFRATCLECLFRLRDPRAAAEVAPCLHSDNPRLRATGVIGALSFGNSDLVTEALAVWHRLLAGSSAECLAGMALLPLVDQLPLEEAALLRQAYRRALIHAFDQAPRSSLVRTLKMFACWRGPLIPELEARLESLSGDTDPQARTAAAHCIHLVPRERRGPLLERALEDGHPQVRVAAVSELARPGQGFVAAALQRIAEQNQGSPRAQRTLLEALLHRGLPSRDLERIACAKVDDALRIKVAIEILERDADADNRGMELLVVTLRERLRQVVDIALLALQSTIDPGTMNVIRAAVQCGDRRYAANACEALRNLDDRGPAATLGRILQESGRGGERPFRDVAQVLHWCRGRADPWLTACAAEASRLGGATI